MTTYAPYALVFLGSYLAGAIPFGYLLYRLRTGRDIRGEGSGNIGATNVARRAGAALGVLTLVLDFLKGLVAVVVTRRLTNDDPWAIALACVAAMVGHIFTVFLRFRGGKGVATAVGVFVAVAPRAVLIAVVVFAVVLAVFRYVSLGSIIGVALFPFLTLIIDPVPWQVTAGAFAGALLVIARHSANIQRLLQHTEPRLSSGPR